MSLAFLFLLSVFFFFLLCPLFCLISLSTTTTSSATSPRPHHRHLRFQWIIKQKSEVQRCARSLRYKSIPEKRQNLHSPLGRWELEMELQTGNGSLAAKQPRRGSRQFSSRRHRGIVGIETIWLIEISSEVLCARIVSQGGACVSWIYGNGKVKWHWINNKKENQQQAIRRHRNRNRNRNRYRWESSARRYNS